MREWAGLPLLTGVVFLVGCGGYTTLTVTPLPTSMPPSAPTAHATADQHTHIGSNRHATADQHTHIGSNRHAIAD